MNISDKKMIIIPIAIAAIIVVYLAGWWRPFFPAGQQFVYKTYYGLSGKQAQKSGSRVETVTFYSAAAGAENEFKVYLPAAYDKNSTDRFPVLYLLHGDPGNDQDWLVNVNLQTVMDNLIAAGRINPMIIVMPDGNGPKIKDSLFLNATARSQNMEDYVVFDTVKKVDSQYRTLEGRNNRAIGGISSGGFAAANIVFHYPEIFGTGFSMGGFFDNWNHTLTPLFGNNESAIAANSPALYVAKLDINPAPSFYLTVGRYDLPSLVSESRNFSAILERKQIPHELTITKGTHFWTTWRNNFPNALAYVNSQFTR